MPGGDLARIFGTVFSKAEERAKAEEDKANKAKQEDIQMYQKVLFDPNSSPEQRQKAADQITKLRGINKKESPFGKLARMLNHVSSRVKPGPGQVEAQPQAAPVATGQGGVAEGAAPEKSNVGQSQAPQKPRGQAMQALGRMFSGQGLLPRHPEQLPPLDPSVFPTADQIRTEKGKDLRQTEDIKWEYEQKKLKLQEELRSVTAAAKARNAMNSKEKYLGQDMINALPANEREGLLDANGVPVDPNGVYGPATGQSIGLAKDEQGNTYLAGVRVGTGPARVGTSQQYVYNPATNKFELTNVGRSTNVPQPPKIGDSSKTGDKKPKKELTPLVPGVGSQGKIPLRSFGPLQKQSNAINEARNSLIGDTPGQIGGVASDIEIFKNPDSVKRTGEYIKYVNSQLEEQGKMATRMGPMAAIEWYSGLPGAISNLQQETLAQYSKNLDGGAADGPEHRFVADYYRLLGTWGGMRAATGASAARWSFKNLISEMPTPGPVTTYADAQRRIKNMANESNVVSKTNPMVQQIDVNQLDKKGSQKVEDILRKHKVIP